MFMINLYQYRIFFLVGLSVFTGLHSMINDTSSTITFSEIFEENAKFPNSIISEDEADLCCSVLYKCALQEFATNRPIMFDTRNHLQCHLNAQYILELFHHYQKEKQEPEGDNRAYMILAYFCSTYFSPSNINQRASRFKSYFKQKIYQQIISEEIDRSNLYTANSIKKKFFGKLITFCGFAPLYNNAKKLLLQRLLKFVKKSLSHEEIPHHIFDNQNAILKDALHFLEDHADTLYCTSEEKRYQEIRIPGFIGGLALVCNAYRLMNYIPILIKTKIICPSGTHQVHKLFGNERYSKNTPTFVVEGATCDLETISSFGTYVEYRKECPFLLLDNIGHQHGKDTTCILCHSCPHNESCDIFHEKRNVIESLSSFAPFLLALSADFTQSEEKIFAQQFESYKDFYNFFITSVNYAKKNGLSGSTPSTFVPEHAHPNIFASIKTKKRFLDTTHDDLDEFIKSFCLLSLNK